VKLTNKLVTLITGAAQGIGAAIAKRLASSGHNIALNYFTNKEKAQITVKECEKLGAEVLLLQADVSNPEECRKIVASTIEKFGRIDLLVNNAGVAQFSKTPVFDLETQSFDAFNTIFNTNVLSALVLSQAVTPHMKNLGRGVIINISSVAGISGATNSSIIYAASKGALNTLTLTLARSLAPTIRVNAVCPALVDSTWWEKRFPDAEQRAKFIEDMTKRNPLGRVITPEEVANTVLFLFENNSINGELIRIDAGAH
jgi:3-oxoacyl-[acyl-carrier protein] reductase